MFSMLNIKVMLNNRIQHCQLLTGLVTKTLETENTSIVASCVSERSKLSVTENTYRSSLRHTYTSKMEK